MPLQPAPEMFCADAHIRRASSSTVWACTSKRPAMSRIACGSPAGPASSVGRHLPRARRPGPNASAGRQPVQPARSAATSPGLGGPARTPPPAASRSSQLGATYGANCLRTSRPPRRRDPSPPLTAAPHTARTASGPVGRLDAGTLAHPSLLRHIRRELPAGAEADHRSWTPPASASSRRYRGPVRLGRRLITEAGHPRPARRAAGIAVQFGWGGG